MCLYVQKKKDLYVLWLIVGEIEGKMKKVYALVGTSKIHHIAWTQTKTLEHFPIYGMQKNGEPAIFGRNAVLDLADRDSLSQKGACMCI